MTPKRILALAALPLILALAACSSTGPIDVPKEIEERIAAASGGTTASNHDNERLAPDKLPDCNLVGAAAADLIGDFVPTPTEAGGVNETPYQVDIGCVWLTPENVSMDISELAKFGGLSIGVSIENNPATRADNEAAGLVHEYEPADEVGAYVLSLNPDFDPADALSAIGVIVAKGNVSVTITAVGLFIDPSNIVDARTNATAIDAALRIHKAMRD